ncbi:MAG: protoporphyrinogen oxidase [Acidobacteriota bacterium]
MSARTNIAVVGGGVSGLAAAFTLLRSEADDLTVAVFEAEEALGGKSMTVQREGFVIEAGPQGYLDTQPALTELVNALGLSEQVALSRPESQRRYFYRDGGFTRVTPNPVQLLRSGLLSAGEIARAATEPLRRRAPEDASVHQFVAHRFGNAVADKLIAPALLGVFAGDVRQLSAAFALPLMTELERTYGSVLIGAVRAARARKREERDVPEHLRPKRSLVSFRDGLGTLVTALEERLQNDSRAALRPATGVHSVRQTTGGYELVIEGGSETFDGVLLATETDRAAALLEISSPPASAALESIPVPPVTVVAMAFEDAESLQLPPGLGVLVPRGQGIRTLGTLWEHQVFDGRAPEGAGLVRSLLGGTVDPAIGDLNRAEVEDLALREFRQMTGSGAEPLFIETFPWPRAIPQYDLDYPALRERIAKEVDSLHRLELAGNSLQGPGFSRAASRGCDAAKSLLKALATSTCEGASAA